MSGHKDHESSAHGPESTPGKQGSMLRDRLSHPHGHKDHKNELDGSELAHALPIHAQKDAYTAGWPH
jgi:hypothetical protein